MSFRNPLAHPENGDPGVIYMQAGTTFGGTGSAGDPLRIRNADFADAVIKAVNADKSIHTVVFLEGAIETKGIWNFPEHGYSTFTRPIRLMGIGREESVLRLAPNAIRHTDLKLRPDAAVIRLGVPNRNNAGPYVIASLTIDGNQGAFKKEELVTGGAVIHSNNSTVDNVRVANLRGSHTIENHPEAFGILINNFPNGDGGHDGGNRISNCIMASNGDVEEYISPFYIGTQQFSRPVAESFLEDCVVVGTGTLHTRLAFSFQANTTIRRCKARRVMHPIYNDVEPVASVLVEDCEFEELGYSGPWITVGAPKSNVLIRRCRFSYEPKKEGDKTTIPIGLTIWDKEATDQPVADIAVEDCEFDAPGQFVPVSLKADAKRVRFARNVVPDGAGDPMIQGKATTASLHYTSNTKKPKPVA